VNSVRSKYLGVTTGDKSLAVLNASSTGAVRDTQSAGLFTIPNRAESKSRPADDATRITLVVFARLVDSRAALTIMKPGTLIRWHRIGASVPLCFFLATNDV
jgi:hypothetical protein